MKLPSHRKRNLLKDLRKVVNKYTSTTAILNWEYNILCTLSTGDKFKNLYCVNSNVVYRYNIDLIKIFKSQKNRLIVIDNADEILGRKEREFILTNFENQYLIIGRNRDGLGLGYNSLGELIVNNKQIYIRYKLKEESEEITRNMKNTKLRFDFDLP